MFYFSTSYGLEEPVCDICVRCTGDDDDNEHGNDDNEDEYVVDDEDDESNFDGTEEAALVAWPIDELTFALHLLSSIYAPNEYIKSKELSDISSRTLSK